MWIEIFKTGTHTDSAGLAKTWTNADLDGIAGKYDPAVHEAPVVIGHPKDNKPAYGWVEALKRSGGVLMAKIKNLAPELMDALKSGLYKKRSISLYPDDALRHVGFLGAVPPAVKGLADVQFAADGEFTEWEWVVDNKERKRSNSGGENHMDDNARVTPHEGNDDRQKITELEAGLKAALERIAELEARLEEAGAPDKSGEEEEMALENSRDNVRAFEEITEIRARAERAEKRAAELEARLNKRDFMTYLDDAGRQYMLSQDLRAGLVDMHEALSSRDFSESESDAGEFIKRIVERMPKLADFKELATKERASDASTEFEEKLKRRTREIAKDRGLDEYASYKEATKELSKENPDFMK